MSDIRKHYGPKVCDGYTIDGYIYENTVDALWYVTSGPASVVVKGDSIRDAVATTFENGMVGPRATSTGTSVAPPLKTAILKTVAGWDRERLA